MYRLSKRSFDRSHLVCSTCYLQGLDQLPREERERRHYSNQQGLSRKHIFDSVERSLKELDLEYIDLLQIHRADENTPFEETMCALKDIVQSGKVRCESKVRESWVSEWERAHGKLNHMHHDSPPRHWRQ